MSAGILSRLTFACVVLALLTTAILSQTPKALNDFDQRVYLSIAYDLDRYGVFSNGVFDDTDSTVAVPMPGMIFGPAYPWIAFAAMKVDGRFAEAVHCAVESGRGHRPAEVCEAYALPIRIVHSIFLTLGVIAIACASEAIFGRHRMFWLAGILSTAALIAEADLLSYVMTESVTFSLYCILAFAMLMFYLTGRAGFLLGGGVSLGLLSLTRAEYIVLLPVLLGVLVWREQARGETLSAGIAAKAAVFALAFFMVMGPWMVRNALSVGKLGVTEEYGSASLIERFAFDDMSAREFALAFPYCVPAIGAPIVSALFGEGAMLRFHYDQPGSFFEVGRAARNVLMAEGGKLDPVIGGVIRQELRQNWWRYLLVIIPLAWCGMWVGSIFSLFLLPAFALGCVRAQRASRSSLLLYSAPAFMMLGLHAAVANHYTRYNLILIGPLSIGVAWFISSLASKPDDSGCLRGDALVPMIRN
jgi:hypothetical protein